MGIMSCGGICLPVTPVIAREPDNGPTRLLCAVVWLKLSRTFLNKGHAEGSSGSVQGSGKAAESSVDGEKVLRWQACQNDRATTQKGRGLP